MDEELVTIVAIATPAGRGGIGVVRLSGPAARRIVEPLLRLRHELAPACARFGELLEAETGAVLDEVVATYFAAPQSYTGEDVVEVSAHGSPVLLDYILQQCCAAGAQLAEPGEFTQRAFLAGRLDLTQAEAVHDLIRSSTLHQAKQAARQLGGIVSRAITPIKRDLIELIAALEAGIDFAEDDIDLLAAGEIERRLEAIHAPLEALAQSYAAGRIVRDGVRLAIVGRPNAGKSSLFNRLLARDRAIVTALPGTTRDAIVEALSLGGIPVELVDTAGLRDVPIGPEGEAERLGIERSGVALAEADIVLLVLDAQTGLHVDDRKTLNGMGGRPGLVVWNKWDLAGESRDLPSEYAAYPALRTSALRGDGIEELKRAILGALAVDAVEAEAALLTNLRQHQAVSATLGSLATARAAALQGIPHEMLLLDLYGALEGLDRLTGATTAEDILRLIFSTFCIGK